MKPRPRPVPAKTVSATAEARPLGGGDLGRGPLLASACGVSYQGVNAKDNTVKREDAAWSGR